MPLTSTYPVIAIDSINDDNEMHIVEAANPDAAITLCDPNDTKRIVCVIEGAHNDARREA